MKHRPFAGAHDLARLQAFTARCIRDHGRSSFLHPGDIPHHIYNGLRREDPTELVFLWEDETGEIRAWTLLDPRQAGMDPQLDPSTRLSHPGLESDVNAWSEEALLNLISDRESTATYLETDAYESDVVRVALLESTGWVAQDAEVLMLTRRALEWVPDPVLPYGFTVRTVRGIEEAGPVSALHAAGFGSSWTTELYERVMTSPGYTPDREIMIGPPDGDLAAFCVTWPDVVNRTGLFEPVAVHPDYWRLGLGRAVMRAGMLAMRDWGMLHAEVMYETENPGSGPLYRGEGFIPVEKVVLYRKPIGTESKA